MRRCALAAVAVLVVLGCDEEVPATQVMVLIEADNAVRSRAAFVRLDIFGRAASDAEFPVEPVQLREVGLDMVDWPLTHALVPRDGDVQRLYKVEAVAMDGDRNEIAHVRAVSGYVRQRLLLLRLRFYSSCLDIPPCEEGFSCGVNGECTDPAQRLAQTLPPWEPIDGMDPGDECSNGALDCPDGVTCTEDACVDGACVNAPCPDCCTDGPDGMCDAVTGCQYSICDDTTCAAEACQVAACMGTECVRQNLCMDGQACCDGACCELGQECCNGTCVAAGCNDGNTCTTDACGDMGCENVGDTAMACDDGLYCTSDESCQMDGSCGGGTDTCASTGRPCDEAMATCVGDCAADAECGPTVRSPPGPCMGFTDMCDDTGMASVTVTTPMCVSNMCTSAMSTDTEACTRVPPSAGMICMTPTWSMLGPCMGPCDGPPGSGSQTGLRTDHACMADTCQARTPIMSSQSCTPPSCPDAGMMDAGPPDAGCMPMGVDACYLPNGIDDDCDTRIDERVSEDCTNGFDDDCNGAFDCADAACSGLPICRDAGTDAGMDSGMDACVPMMEVCNGLDDDCDVMIDEGAPCTPDGGPPRDACMPASPIETICNDLFDDDCDGFIDCLDCDCMFDPRCGGIMCRGGGGPGEGGMTADAGTSFP